MGSIHQPEIPTPQVFLCHSFRDKKFVRRLANDIMLLGAYPWLDEWQLAPGASLHEAIGSALTSCAFVAVIMSPDSIESKWCRKELHQTLAREDATDESLVIPLRIRRVQPPPFLADRLYLDFSRSYFEALARLIGHLFRLDLRLLTSALIGKRLSSLDEVQAVLRTAGWHAPFLRDPENFKHLRQLAAERGIELGEIFTIIPGIANRGPIVC